MRRRHPGPRRGIAFALACLMLATACGAGPDDRPLARHVRTGPVDDLGLLTGKPYNGTKIRLLTCCNTAAQFLGLRARTDAEFTKRTGIEVEWANIAYESFLQKIVAESALGTGTYDLVAWTDAFGASIREGVQPLNEVMRRSNITLDDYPPAFREAATAGRPGVTYGIPFRGYAYALYYRKDQYDALGLKAPETWDEYLTQLDRLKAASPRHAVAGQYGRGSGQNLFTWLSMLWSAGGDLFDAEGKAAFTSPAAVEATEKYISMLRKGYSPPASANWTETDSTQSMEQGHANTVLTWTWQYDDFTDPTKVKPDVAKAITAARLPGWPGRERVSYGMTWLMGVLRSSEKQGPAWEYIKWVTDPRTERAVALDKSDPAKASGITVHTSNMLDPQVNAANGGIPRLQEEALRDSRIIPTSIDWPRIQDAVEVAINRMAHGADVRSELRSAARQVDQIQERDGG
ncbi:sugar ABC transporter substrate-binding protein [Actinomadura viridis]|uniref:Multiple sugar transport system substrate-binding protein n=1 Tax=Actinomadura viridis TaxID=58110 RepID=A0A931DEJ3_9ACTN|nr:sugar ABC transporter substrate-binding protein [Actinomadura viridis]MBG6086021.1 multiple sugar transport system substrate-binding protein [Actinomadura viridis]